MNKAPNEVLGHNVETVMNDKIFGVTITPGGARNWYVGADGVKRWSNNDSPVHGA